MTLSTLRPWWMLALCVAACSGDDTVAPKGDDTGATPTTSDTDTDADTDTDTDTDADTDSDADADADTDADTDTDTGVVIPNFTCPYHDFGSTTPASFSGSTVGQPDWGGGSCGGLGPDVHLTFTADIDASYIFDTIGSSYDTVLYVQDGCGGSELACADNNAGQAERVMVDLFAGDEVAVVVDGVSGAGDFVVNVMQIPFEETDCTDRFDEDRDGATDCDDTDCQVLEGCTPGGQCPEFTRDVVPTTVEGFTSRMNHNDVPPCGPGGNTGDARIEFTAPADGDYLFSTAGSDFDTTLWLTDTCTSGSLVCDTNGGPGVTSQVSHRMTAGQTVIAHVDGAGEEGVFQLTIDEKEANESTCDDGLDSDDDGLVDCADSDCIVDPACIEDCDNDVDEDLDGLVDCRDPDCDDDPVCEEDCTNFEDDDLDGHADCGDSQCNNLPMCEEDCSDGVDNDGDIRVDCGDNYCWDDVQCTEDCSNGVDDNGDGRRDCADAQCASHVACCAEQPVYTTGKRTGSNNNRGDQFRPTTCANPANDGADVSFEFTAPSAGTYTFETAGSDYDTVLYLLDSCEGAELACDDDGGPGTQSLLTYTMDAGQTVVVVVDGYSSASTGDYELTVD